MLQKDANDKLRKKIQKIHNQDNFKVMVKTIEVGNLIICQGQKIKVVEILTQESYFFQGEAIYNIEFRDEKGEYHHWKSNIDGGFIMKG